MSTIDERHARASAGVALNADTDGWYGDFARPRVYLQPIAAPSVLGLFGFAGATFIVAAHMAGWHGTWGSFWMGYGLLQLLLVTGVLHTGGTLDSALGFWFIALCAITFSGMAGAFAEGNLGVTVVLGTLAAGSGLAAVAFLANSTGTEHAAGWVFVISAALAWYVATG